MWLEKNYFCCCDCGCECGCCCSCSHGCRCRTIKLHCTNGKKNSDGSSQYEFPLIHFVGFVNVEYRFFFLLLLFFCGHSFHFISIFFDFYQNIYVYARYTHTSLITAWHLLVVIHVFFRCVKHCAPTKLFI